MEQNTEELQENNMGEELLKEFDNLEERKNLKIVKLHLLKIAFIKINDKCKQINYKTGEVFSAIQTYALNGGKHV